MNIFSRPSYRRAIKRFPAQQVSQINAAISQLPESIGNPHRHSGLSIRRLRPSIFELRVGLDIRVMFMLESSDVILLTVGDHDTIKNFLKENF